MSGQVMWRRELAEARLAAWHFTWQTGLQFGQMTYAPGCIRDLIFRTSNCDIQPIEVKSLPTST
jgi:hypothetical protein